jgi:hypothetical protein
MEAKQRAVEAERLAVSCDDLLCQAESVEMQGKVALRQRDLPVCIRFFERAIPLWQRAQKSSEALTQRGLARTLIGLTYGTLAARQLSVARGHVVEAVARSAARAATPYSWQRAQCGRRRLSGARRIAPPQLLRRRLDHSAGPVR